ncbi:MAG TPA: hypothetical protein VGO08_22295 [Burkholderiales bacterium]|jgi:hypothetical protein|nr:hypothetical protein [Burkholderiales bacterium]
MKQVNAILAPQSFYSLTENSTPHLRAVYPDQDGSSFDCAQRARDERV